MPEAQLPQGADLKGVLTAGCLFRRLPSGILYRVIYIENLILERMKLDSGPHILGAFGRGEGAFGAVVNRLQFRLNLAANKRGGVVKTF